MGAGNQDQSLEVLEIKGLLDVVIGGIRGGLRYLIVTEFDSKIPWEDNKNFSSAYKDKLREFGRHTPLDELKLTATGVLTNGTLPQSPRSSETHTVSR